MGSYSGQYGFIDGISGISTIRDWTINDRINLIEIRASNTAHSTGNAVQRKGGIKEWDGSWNAYGGNPAAMPGDIIAAGKFYSHADTDGTPGAVPGDAGYLYQGSLIVDSVEITWDFAEGAIISHSVNFSGIGDVSLGIATATPDPTTPDTPTVCAAGILYQAFNPSALAETAILNVTQAVLTISAANLPTINSSSSPICTRGFLKGNIDWGLSITREDNTYYAVKAAEGLYNLQVSQTALDRWLLRWGMISDHSDYTVNIENDEIISHNTNVAMQSVLTNAAGLGQIVRPGEDVDAPWWGQGT